MQLNIVCDEITEVILMSLLIFERDTLLVKNSSVKSDEKNR